MIAEQVVGRPRIALAHRYPLTAGVVVFDHLARAAGPPEVIADVGGGHAVQHGFDKGAVPASEQAVVVDEAGARCAAHGGQAIFGVVGKSLFHSIYHNFV